MLENDLKFLEETFKQYYFDHFDLDSHLNLLPDPASGLQMNAGVVSVEADQPGHGVSLTC